MVSKRNFFAIFLMMFVVFFLCQFSQVMRNHLNRSDNDSYDNIQMPLSSDEWNMDSVFTVSADELEGVGDYTGRNIIFVGSPDSESAQTVKQWCRMIKATLTFYQILPLYSTMDHSLDYMILIDGESLSTGCYMSSLSSYVRKGTTVVFLTLPPVRVIQANESLQNLLGITKILDYKITVEGIRVFDGTFVGGEATYKADNVEDKVYQDMNLTMPWYVTAEGSKTYIVGLLDEKKYERESFPRIVWRYSGGKTKVFAVNGDYIKGPEGLGLLDMFLYESADFALYPVVNAQTSLFLDIPGMSDEQEEVMRELYYRDSDGAQRDIFLPNIISVVEKNSLIPTFLIRTRYDMDNDTEPDKSHLEFYLEEIRGLSGEAGRSFRYNGNSCDLEGKIQFDSLFYNDPEISYHFRTAYVDSLAELTEVNGRTQDESLFNEISTVAGCGDTNELFFYLNDNTTFQNVTQDAMHYSYSSDFLARSLNTSIGYSALKVSLNNAFQPDSKEEQWENYFDLVNTNIFSYWHKFNLFEQTTLSESDYRIRKFLALDYDIYYENDDSGQTITLFTNNSDECWFLLRTHEQKVKSVDSGDCQLIEKNVYLVHVTGEKTVINLQDSDEVYNYANPF